MIKSCLLAALLLLMAGVGLANPPTIQSKADLEPTPAGSSLCSQFNGFPQARISREGNFLSFIGINSGNHMYREGYVLCDAFATRHSSNDADVGFAPATCSCSGGNTCTVIRNTSDGRMRLTQTITKTASNLSRAYDVTMKLDNLTGSPIPNLILRRVATIDIASAVSEFHASTRESAFTWGTKSAGIPYSVRMRRTTAPNPTAHEGKVTNFNDWSCSPADQSANGPVFGDKNITVQFNLGTLQARKSTTVAVQYVRD